MASGIKPRDRRRYCMRASLGLITRLIFIADRAGTSDRERPLWGKTGSRAGLSWAPVSADSGRLRCPVDSEVPQP